MIEPQFVFRAGGHRRSAFAQGEQGIVGRRFFQKGGQRRTHHVHALSIGDANVMRHVAFRDYLRSHPKVAEEYATLKKISAATSGKNIERYIQGKLDFVKETEKLALAWSGK